MARRTALFVLAAAALTTGAQAQDIRKVQVHFPAGATGTTINDHIVGYQSVSYLIGASAGQFMTVSLRSSNTGTYFNVYEPGRGPGDQALANSENVGDTVPDLNRFAGPLPASGAYIVSVYMVRAAARRNERADYALDIAISAQGAAKSQDAKVPGTQFHATGEIPCSRQAGQPLANCKFGVVRRGRGEGDVTVFWPDGGNRTIFFQSGAPASADISQADGGASLQFVKDADLFRISIGQERFEIFEAVIFGG